jgi:four helix bundle protein
VFQQTTIWQKAMNLAEQVFTLTETLPRKEDYGLTSQLRRAAVSISSNFAEGYGREHTRDKLQFFYTARGSLFEVQSQLLYGKRVKYFNEKQTKELLSIVNELKRELNTFIKSMKNRE